MSSTPVPQGTTETQKQSDITNPSWLTRAVEFWWVEIPGKLRRYSTLLWAAWSDGIYLTAWPRITSILTVAVFLFGFIEGGTHWSPITIWDQHMSADPAVAFAQMPYLLVVGVVLGSLSANLGLTLVLGYALGDFFWAGPPNFLMTDLAVARFFYLRVPQLVSYLLFFTLTVTPILTTKILVFASDRRVREWKILKAGLMAVVQALLLWEWTFFAPMVFRVMWSWPGRPAQVTVGYFHDVTAQWLMISGVAAVIVRQILSAILEKREAVASRALRLTAQLLEPLRVPAWKAAVISALLITLLMSGFVDSFNLGAVVFVCIAVFLLVRAYVLPKGSLWMKWQQFVRRYPALLRLAVAVVATYLVTQAVLTVPALSAARNGVPGQFGVELVCLGLGLFFLFTFLPEGLFGSLEDRESERIEGAPITLPPQVAVAVRMIAVVFLVLLATKKAFATCLDPACCFQGDSGLAAAATAGAIPTGAAVSPPGPTKPTWLDRASTGAQAVWDWFTGVVLDPVTAPGIGEVQPLLSSEGAEAEAGAIQGTQEHYTTRGLRDGMGDEGTEDFYRRRHQSLQEQLDESKKRGK
ncbi:MAG TPA: hypothetical protein VEM96_20455 [Pyrinomonadaceae bacterium]|nr:hypothetical protein [Pyrinomonadaceae bacterium]